MRNELLDAFRKNGYECYISTKGGKVVYTAFHMYLQMIDEVDVDAFQMVDKRVFVSEKDNSILVELLKIPTLDNNYKKVETVLKEKGFREIIS